MKSSCIFIALASLGAAIPLSSCHGSHEPTPEPPAKVEVINARFSPVSSSRAYSGTVEESTGTDLSFELAGKIRSVNVEQGDRVSKGQLIATLDNSSLQNAYEIAKAALNETQDMYDRMKKLYDSNSLPDMKWVEAQNALKSAQSSEAIARRTLSNAAIYAPFAGYISERNAEAGSVTAPAVPVARLVIIDPVKVNVSVSETEIAKVREGQPAQVTLASMPGEVFSGKVSERGVSANPVSRTYNVKVSVPNPDGKLLPGMICDLRFETTDSVNAMVLPYDAVLLDANNRNFVWIARNGEASKRIVEIGEMLDSGLTVTSGLSEGEAVIVAGQQKVSEGGKIRVINR